MAGEEAASSDHTLDVFGLVHEPEHGYDSNAGVDDWTSSELVQHIRYAVKPEVEGTYDDFAVRVLAADFSVADYFSCGDPELVALGVRPTSVPTVRADIERLRTSITTRPKDFWEYRVANPKEAHLFTILAFAAPRPLMFYLWAFNQKGVLESVFAAPTWGSLLQALRAPEDAAFSALSLVFPNLAVGVFATHVFWRLHPLIVLSYLCHAILPTFRQACSLVGIFSEEGSRLAKVADHTIGRAGLYAGGPLALLAVSASAAIAALRALKQLLIFDVASFTSAYAMHTAFYYTVPRAFQFLNLFTSIYLGPLMVFGKILVLAFQSAVRVCLRNPGPDGPIESNPAFHYPESFCLAFVKGIVYISLLVDPAATSAMQDLDESRVAEAILMAQKAVLGRRTLQESVAFLILNLLAGQTGPISAFSLELRRQICAAATGAPPLLGLMPPPPPPTHFPPPLALPAGVDVGTAPPEFLCPITSELMLLPTVLRTTTTAPATSYDYTAIAQWLATNGECPLTRQVSGLEQLEVNVELRAQIAAWIAGGGGATTRAAAAVKDKGRSSGQASAAAAPAGAGTAAASTPLRTVSTTVRPLDSFGGDFFEELVGMLDGLD